MVSSVYFANTEEVYLYHIYDDRGADLVAERKETLWPIYHNFNQWILDCDRKKSISYLQRKNILFRMKSQFTGSI